MGLPSFGKAAVQGSGRGGLAVNFDSTIETIQGAIILSDEARINVATGFQGGVSVSVRADSPEELSQLLAGVSQHAHLAKLFAPVLDQVSEQQGIANVHATFPQAVPAANNVVPFVPTSTVGQPVATPPASPAAVPPGVQYPGDCAHGQRQYRDSIARGKPWRRWECAQPWVKGGDNSTRCAHINV